MKLLKRWNLFSLVFTCFCISKSLYLITIIFGKDLVKPFCNCLILCLQLWEIVIIVKLFGSYSLSINLLKWVLLNLIFIGSAPVEDVCLNS